MSLALCLVVLALLVDSGYGRFGIWKLFKRREDACSVDTYESISCRRVVDKNNNEIIELKETTQLLDKYDISYNSHMHEYLYKKLKNENMIDEMLLIYRDEQRFMLYTTVYYYQCFIFPCTFAIITITTCYMLYYYIFFAQNFKQIWFTASLLIWMLLLSIVYYSLNFIF
jgi:hypothetical protein